MKKRGESGKGVAVLALSYIAISSNWRISWPDKHPQDTCTQTHTLARNLIWEMLEKLGEKGVDVRGEGDMEAG